jgi:hypothetical protein
VVVDGISVRDVEPRVAMATECKSGANVDVDQAKSYGAMTCTDVARFVGLPFDHNSATLQPLYACLTESRDRVRLGLDKAGLDAPLLVIGDAHVRLEAAAGHQIAAFNEVIPVGQPPRYVVVDALSDDQEFLEVLLPELMATVSRGDEFVSLDTLLRAAVPYWDVFGADARKQLRARARDALVIAFEKNFVNDFRFEATGPKLDREVVRVLARPGEFDPRGQTQGWQRLRRQASVALGRGPSKRPAPGQQTFFEDLGLGIEIGET